MVRADAVEQVANKGGEPVERARTPVIPAGPHSVTVVQRRLCGGSAQFHDAFVRVHIERAARSLRPEAWRHDSAGVHMEQSDLPLTPVDAFRTTCGVVLRERARGARER